MQAIGIIIGESAGSCSLGLLARDGLYGGKAEQSRWDPVCRGGPGWDSSWPSPAFPVPAAGLQRPRGYEQSVAARHRPACFVLGLALAVWARVYLGRNWGMPMSRRADPELVTTGPYRRVRHPIYSGLILAMAGTAIAVSLYWLNAVGDLRRLLPVQRRHRGPHHGQALPRRLPALQALASEDASSLRTSLTASLPANTANSRNTAAHRRFAPRFRPGSYGSPSARPGAGWCSPRSPVSRGSRPGSTASRSAGWWPAAPGPAGSGRS